MRGRARNGDNEGGNRTTVSERGRGRRSRRREGTAESRGRRQGGRRGRGGRRGDKPKSKTAEELDAEMDVYWGKSEEHASKRLDTDMDDYWKTKDESKEVNTMKTSEDDGDKKNEIGTSVKKNEPEANASAPMTTTE